MSNLLRLVVGFAAVDRLSGTLKGIVGLAQSGGERLAGMKREARDLDRELRGVQGELARSSGNVTELIGREAALKAQISRTNGEMDKQVRLLKIQAQVEKMRARGDALKSAGQGNVMGGAAMLAPLFLAGKGAADFQSGMTDIALKAALSRKDTDALQGNIMLAARAAKQLPENMRAGVDVLAGFGMSPKQATRMIAPIGKVATAYRAEISDLAAASFANFSNLKVPIAQNAQALEIMAAAGNAGAFEIKDMAQYFPSLTAQAQAFGQKGVSAVADLAAAAQIARKGTGDSASAATNLQNLLAKINTKETIDKFDKMGVDLPAALKRAYAQGKTPLEAIAEITNKTLGGNLSRISFLFGDMQAQSALRPLIQNMDEYRKIRADALASKGAVDAAFARRSEDANTMTIGLVGNLQRLAVTLGPVLLPPFLRITEAALALTDRFAAWAQANPGLSGTLLSIVAGLAVARIGLGVLQFGLGAFLGPAASAFGLIMRSGPSVAGIFGGIRVAALFLARGVVTAGAMMLANPLVALIVGIVAALGFAGYMIYSHWGVIKGAFGAGITFVQGKWTAFQAWLTGGVSWFVGLHAQFALAGAQMMQGLWNGITSRVAAIKSLITGIAGSVVGWFKNVLGIHSPSRVFMGLGGHIAGGLALGIAQGQGAPAMAAQTMADQVIAGPRLQLRGQFGQSAPASSGGASFGPVTITINAAPGQSATDIAEEVQRILDKHASKKSAARRSSYDDED